MRRQCALDPAAFAAWTTGRGPGQAVARNRPAAPAITGHQKERWAREALNVGSWHPLRWRIALFVQVMVGHALDLLRRHSRRETPAVQFREHGPPNGLVLTKQLGPGTRLETILRELGIRSAANHLDQGLKSHMNHLGVDGCLRDRGSLISEIRQSHVSISLFKKLRIMCVARPPAWLNPLDVVGSAFDEAVGRASVAKKFEGLALESLTERQRGLVVDHRRFWESLTPACGFLGPVVGKARVNIRNVNSEIYQCSKLTRSDREPTLCVLSSKVKRKLHDNSILSCDQCAHFSAPRWISSRRMLEDIHRLIDKLPQGITAVAGHARSGLMPATYVSMALHVPMWIIRSTEKNGGDVVHSGNGWRIDQGAPEKPGSLLVVDDNCMTGNSLTRLRHIIRPWAKDQGFRDVLEAIVYVNPLAQHQPDIYAVNVPWPSYYEWNFFNGTFSPGFALDFDGILCRDCTPEEDDDGNRYLEFLRTARPRYLPRREPVKMIVTGRREKYRAETMAWLDRHGVQVEQLIMHPNGQRTFESIVALKSRWFAEFKGQAPSNLKTGPRMFVESDPVQAPDIAKRAGGNVICPDAERVYQ